MCVNDTGGDTWSFEHTIIGVNSWTRADHTALLTMVGEGRLKPVIDRVVPMEGVVAAMHDLSKRRVTGEVVIRVG